MTPETRSLTLGVILPHTRIFGGVKRFFEIGNVLVPRGHRFLVFTPDGERPTWFAFKGEVCPLSKIEDYVFDAFFITEPEYLDKLKTVKTRLRIFYAILQRRSIKKVVADRDLLVLANSLSLYNYLGGAKRSNLVICPGGIDPVKFDFRLRRRDKGEPLNVLAYGRFYRRKKGTMMVVKACEQLHKQGYLIKLLLFDTPVDERARKRVEKFSCKVPFGFFVDYPVEKLAELYHKADIFVSAERNAGWSNTTAEAMACGVPVIATRSGTADFLVHGETGLTVWRHSWFIKRALIRLYEDDELRHSLAVNGRRRIEMFSWTSLAEKIEWLIFDRLQMPS